MIESEIIKKSFLIFTIIEALTILLGIVLNSISYPIGLLFGYLISLIIFKFTIFRVDFILGNKVSSYLLIFLEVIGKFIIYILALLLGICVKDYFNLWSIFIGLFIIKITVLVVTSVERRKKG